MFVRPDERPNRRGSQKIVHLSLVVTVVVSLSLSIKIGRKEILKHACSKDLCTIEDRRRSHTGLK